MHACMLGDGRGAPVRVASGAAPAAAALVFRRRELRRRERRGLGPAAAAPAAADGPRRRRGARRGSGRSRAAGNAWPIVIGACAGRGGAGAHRGPLQRQDRPPADRAAGARPAEIEALQAAVPPAPLAADLLGAWDFSREISSTRVVDLSANGLHGRLRNFPTRAVTGAQLDRRGPALARCPRAVRRDPFPRRRPRTTPAGRPSCALTLPEGLRSGIYAARLRAGDDEAYVPFFVRPPRGRATRADRLPGADRDLHGLRQLPVLGRPSADRAAASASSGVRRGRRSVPAASTASSAPRPTTATATAAASAMARACGRCSTSSPSGVSCGT